MRPVATLLLTSVLVATIAPAQSPLPSGNAHEKAQLAADAPRIELPITATKVAAQHFAQGLGCLNMGLTRQAERSFLTGATVDPTSAINWLGCALSCTAERGRGARYSWEAYQRRDGTKPWERKLIEAYAHWFGGTSEPEERQVNVELDIWEAVAAPISDATTAVLRQELQDIGAIPGSPWTVSDFLDVTKPPTPSLPQKQWYDAFPYDIPGYGARLSSLSLECHARGIAGSIDHLAELAALPRHPLRGHHEALTRQAATALKKAPRLVVGDGPMSPMPFRWSPPMARDLSLPIGTGGQFDLKRRAGKPTLVVFFLGFGCIHCIDQLQELRPRNDAFKAAGIEIITVGSDPAAAVQASIQRAIENDNPAMPFPVLCDTESVAFKSWGCWDEFKNEPLHGTFLIDGEGKVRWRDVSYRPFMDTEFLLKECRRLLKTPAR